MVRRLCSILLLIVLFTHSSLGQNKAVVLQNVWNNDLNNYNPKDFLESVFSVLKNKLSVQELTQDSKNVSASGKDEKWKKYLKEQIDARKASRENCYFIAITNDLRLPAFNLGKFLFKNPPRSSKLTFTFHVYDTSGLEIIGDTIVNRGCLIRTLDEGKGSKYFYSDYSDFRSDMQCHLEAIRTVLHQKQFPKKSRRYLETR